MTHKFFTTRKESCWGKQDDAIFENNSWLRLMGREWKFENVGIDGTMFGVFYSLPIRRSTQSCQRDWVSRRFKGNELRFDHWTTNNVGIRLLPRFNLEFKIQTKLTPRQLQVQWCAFSSLADLPQTPAEGRRPRHTHIDIYTHSRPRNG